MEVMPIRVADLKALQQGLRANTIDFAPIPNYSYPELLKSVHILATSKYENKKRMYLYIVANKKSGIKDVKDLKGTAAGQVVEDNKLKCYFLAESIKANPKEYLGRVETYSDLRDAVNAVAEGKIDSTCLSSTAWEILTSFDPSLKQNIRIIKRSPAYAMDPVVASRKLHESIWWNIQSVLIAMSRDYAAQQILMYMGVQGFGSPVTDLSAYPSLVSQAPAIPALAIDEKTQKKRIAVPVEEIEETQPLETIDEPATSEELVSDEPSHDESEVVEETPVLQELPQDTPGEVQVEVGIPAVVPLPQKPRSWFRKGLENQLYMKGGLIFLLVLMGLTILSMILRRNKNKTLTVLLRMDNQVAALRSSLDWKGKLHIESCHISQSLSKGAITTLLNTIGHKAAMKLALILNSDRIIVQEFTFPLLTDKEIPAAIHWKLQDLNVPYDQETDIIHHTLTSRDRKRKQIALMAMILPKEDDGGDQWTGLPVEADATLCVQMALLSRFRKCAPSGTSSRIMLAYRLNMQEALVLILQGDNSFISRRIYATADPSVTKDKDVDVWGPFMPELEQTVNFQNRSTGNSLLTIYLSGLGVSDTPDPDGTLSEHLGIPVEGIDFLSDIDVSDGVREGCPAIEVLAGAALMYHKQAK
jgi:ABC-type phosphate/phosphonate transport system substrate-binding protein